MQSTNMENEAQQGSPEHMEHQWHMENDSNNVFRNDFITRYIVTFKGINKPYLTSQVTTDGVSYFSFL